MVLGCKKFICVECLFNNFVVYSSLRCPYCRVDIDNDILIEQIKKHKSIFDNYNFSIVPKIYKSSLNGVELIEKLNNNLKLLLNVKSVLGSYIVNTYQDLLNNVQELPPCLLGVSKDKNILFITKDNFNDLVEYILIKLFTGGNIPFKNYNIDEVGIFRKDNDFINNNKMIIDLVNIENFICNNIKSFHNKPGELLIKTKVITNKTLILKEIKQKEIYNKLESNNVKDHLTERLNNFIISINILDIGKQEIKNSLENSFLLPIETA